MRGALWFSNQLISLYSLLHQHLRIHIRHTSGHCRVKGRAWGAGLEKETHQDLNGHNKWEKLMIMKMIRWDSINKSMSALRVRHTPIYPLKLNRDVTQYGSMWALGTDARTDGQTDYLRSSSLPSEKLNKPSLIMASQYTNVRQDFHSEYF